MSDAQKSQLLNTKLDMFERNYRILKIVVGALSFAVATIFFAGYYYHSALSELDRYRNLRGMNSSDVTMHAHSAINVVQEVEKDIGEHRYCAISKYSNTHSHQTCTCEIRKKEKSWSIVLSSIGDIRCECFAACIK